MGYGSKKTKQKTTKQTKKQRNKSKLHKLQQQQPNFVDAGRVIDEDGPQVWPLQDDDTYMADESPIDHFLYFHAAQKWHSRSRATCGENTTFEFTNVHEALRPDRLMERAVDELIGRVARYAQKKLGKKRRANYVGFQITNDTMQSPYYVPIRTLAQNNAKTIAAEIEWVAQSNDDLRLLNGRLHAKVIMVWLPTGNCRDQRLMEKKVRSLVEIVNPTDQWCMARAVAVALAYHKYVVGANNRRAFARVTRVGSREQKRMARKLLRLAGIDLEKEHYDLRDLKHLQRWLDRRYGRSAYRIVVFAKDLQNRILWKKDESARHNLYLYYAEEHFHFVEKPWQLMRARDFCVDCER